MIAKITGFLREFIFILSITTIIIGLIICTTGILGIINFNISDLFIEWSPYLLIIGLIIFITGLYYLYSFIKKKNFVIKEIKTKKRSDFIKKHGDLKDTVRYLPSKYKILLKEKEKELKIK
jgi:uncharacterized membrane protein